MAIFFPKDFGWTLEFVFRQHAMALYWEIFLASLDSSSVCDRPHFLWIMRNYSAIIQIFRHSPGSNGLPCKKNLELFRYLKKLSLIFYPLSGLVLAGFAGMILTTVVDMVATKLDVRIAPLAVAMSAYTNGRNLFSLRKNKDHIQCLYGIRALALIWLMYGYRHFLSVILPLINTLDFILDVSRLSYFYYFSCIF